MARKITSDDIKAQLVKVCGGAKSDWKRLGKRKNEQGLWQREFQNKKTGIPAVVVETPDNKLMVYVPKDAITPGLTEEANASFGGPECDRAARKVMEILADEDYDGEHFYDDDSLLKAAGQNLAKQFCFAVMKDHDGMFSALGMKDTKYFAVISPLQEWEEMGVQSDMPAPIEHLLPPGEDVNECGNWVFNDIGKTAAEIFTELKARGFNWDTDFQNDIDRTLTDELEKLDKPAPRVFPKNRGRDNTGY